MMDKIDPAKGWYSAQELAGLPGVPGTDSAVMRMAKKIYGQIAENCEEKDWNTRWPRYPS